MMRSRCFMFAVIAFLATADSTGASAQERSGRVKQTFETYGLLGIFGVDCAKVASKRNLYHVHRALDDDHVQADQMSGPANQDFALMIDQIVEIKPNTIVVSGTINAHRYSLTLSLSGTRKRTIEMVREPGDTVITGGKRVSNGEDLPWHNKCS